MRERGNHSQSVEEQASATPEGPADALIGFVRTEDLAVQFGVSERTIQRWIRLRLLPQPVRLGRTTLHHLPTIREFMAEQSQARPTRGRKA